MSKIATFMPKPFFDDRQGPSSSWKKNQDDNGSGMHVNVSVWKEYHDGKRNVFYDPNDSYAELSRPEDILSAGY